MEYSTDVTAASVMLARYRNQSSAFVLYMQFLQIHSRHMSLASNFPYLWIATFLGKNLHTLGNSPSP